MSEHTDAPNKQPEHDELSRLYREAAAPQPPPAVDRTIRRAARHAAGRRTTAAGPFSRSWMIPLSAAAVLVLTVGLTAILYPRAKHPPAGNQFAEPPSPTRAPAVEKPSGAPALSEEPSSALRSAPQPAPAREATRDSGAGPEAETPARQDAASEGDASGAISGLGKSRSGKQKKADDEDRDPEAWLEHIRQLRREGRDQEAARSLEQFRERYPDYPVQDPKEAPE